MESIATALTLFIISRVGLSGAQIIETYICREEVSYPTRKLLNSDPASSLGVWKELNEICCL